MFYVWDATRVQRPYVPGAVRTSRSIQQVESAQQVKGRAFSTSPEITEHTVRASVAKGVAAYRDPTINQEPHRRRIILASDLMTAAVVSVTPQTKIQAASELFSERRFRHLPVIDDAEHIVGIVSDRDILKWNAKRQLRNIAAEAQRMHEYISEIMVKEVLSASANTEIREIAGTMFEERVGCMPITDEQGTLQGIITRSDVLRALLVRAPLELWS